MAIYKPYPKYKNSNIPWLGEIPEHWMETKPKFLGFLFGGLSGKSGSDFSKDFVKGYKAYIPFTNIANNRIISLKNLHYVKIGENEKQNKVQKGDLFFLMSSENFEDIGKTALLNDEVEDVYLNSFCKGLRITDNNFDSSFINYLFNADVNRKQLIIQARGFTRINLKIGKVNDLQLFTPTDIEEQTAIARFLDYKLAKINRFIQKKKQLIKLLNEQKAAIINQVVTKGLDPNVKMKDSGIEWLGEIPQHWEKYKLKYLISKPIAGAWGTEPQNDDNDITCVRVADFSEYEIKTDNLTIRNIEAKTEQILKPGDLLLEKSGGGEKTPVGRVVLFNQSFKAVTSNFVSKFSPKIDLVSSEYLLYIFKLINSVRWNFRSLKQTTGIQNIDTYQYMDNWVFIPKIEEQKIIVNHIKSEFKILDETISKIEKEIALVEEYKTALIAEAVTGKIDVRGYEVPEVTEEETYEEIEEEISITSEDAEAYQTVEK